MSAVHLRGNGGVRPFAAACFLAALAGEPAVMPATAADGSGDVRAANLLLWQAGRDPRTEAVSGTGLFDQFDLEYGRGALRAGIRWESFRPSRDEGFLPARHDEITLKFAEWESDGVRLNVGHGFATIGRGLLFRAFELRGVVRDAVFPPSQYVDSRSLDGVVIAVDRGPVSALVFGGEPVRYPDAPPGVPDLPRREGTVGGAHASVTLHPALTLGAGYLRNERVPAGAPAERAEYASADLDLGLAQMVPALAARDIDARFYAEYAGRSWDPFADGLDTEAGTPHAFYTATQLSHGRWGASLETKEYDSFALGWNDPPNLVPEMSQHLLNRMSHFLLADGEKGHQVSVMGSLPREWTLQFESARARNEVNGLRRYHLDSLTLQGGAQSGLHWEVFTALGRDEVEGISEHRTGGVSLGRDVGRGFSLRLSGERQRAERTTFDVVSAFDNTFLSLALDRSGLGTLALLAEFSDDPDEMDDPLTFDVVETASRSWLGLIASAPLNRHHEAILFLGSRRGGTACTSGTCYLVPDFGGAELRLLSRF